MSDEYVYMVNKLNRDGTRGIYFGFKAPIDIPGHQRFFFIGPWSRSREEAIRHVESVLQYARSNAKRLSMCGINDIKEALKRHLDSVRGTEVDESNSLSLSLPEDSHEIQTLSAPNNEALRILRWMETDRGDESTEPSRSETPISPTGKRQKSNTSLEEARIKLADKFLDTFSRLISP